MKLRLLIIFSIVMTLNFRASAQHFPKSRATYPQEIPQKLSELKRCKDPKQKAVVLLQLGICYMYKPGERDSDLDSALILAQQVKSLSKRLHYQAIYDEAVMLTAGCYLEKKDREKMRNQIPLLKGRNRIKLLTYIGDEYYYAAYRFEPVNLVYLDTALQFYHQKLMVSKPLGDKKIIQQSIDHIQHCMLIFNDRDSFDRLQREMDWLNKNTATVKFYVQPARLSAMLARHYMYIGENLKAQDAIINASKLINGQSSLIDKNWVYDIAGHLYRVIGQYEKSNDYYFKALAYPQFYKSLSYYAVIHFICYNYGQLGKFDKADSFLADMQKRYPPATNWDKFYNQRALGLNALFRKQYDIAERYFLEAIKISGNAQLHTSGDYKYLGDLYSGKGDFERAAEAYGKSELKTFENHPTFFSVMYKKRAHADSVLGNYASAFNYLFKSKKIDDSLYNVSKTKHAQELEIQYETQKKEAELQQRANSIRFLNQKNILQQQNSRLQQVKLIQAAQLAHKDSAIIKLKERDLTLKTKDLTSLSQIASLQKAELKQADTNKKITIGIILLLLIVTGLSYRQFRQKRDSNLLITRKNEMLNSLLADKEWLLKEVHHRVKNNLQTIVNLLESQSDHLEEPAYSALETSKNRIYAMSLLHHKLYQADESSTIDMSVYIGELVCFLRDTFSAGAVTFIVDIDAIRLDAGRAIPIGLIINEVVTNSLKYAFNGPDKGTITIGFKESPQHWGTLSIADDGIGIPADKLTGTPATMGLKLIRGLARQLEGELMIDNKAGTCFVVSALMLTDYSLVEV